MALSRELERGRKAFQRRGWVEAYASFSRADEAAELDAEDLDRFGIAAYLLGRYEDSVAALERAHHGFVETHRPTRAARSALILSLQLFERGDLTIAGGWLARARRILEGEEECAEHGYLLLPDALMHAASEDQAASFESASRSASIAERFGDADLLSYARCLQGRALLKQGRFTEGLGLLDEAMVAVTADEVSPLFAGIVYCSVIDMCREISDLRRAHEWTGALSRWCDKQPDIIPFSGQCLVHRAEVMTLRGAWADGVEEAHRAIDRLSKAPDRSASGDALYQVAEVHRLRGDFDRAEQAYQEASGWGRDPHPGLALLWLAKGRGDAPAAILRAVSETTDQLKRSKLLPAQVEIMLATGDVASARAAAVDLSEIAGRYDTVALRAASASAQGSVNLAEGDASAALLALRAAWRYWSDVGASYEAARVRVRIAEACSSMGDEGTARLELDAARESFRELGAYPDLEAISERATDARDDSNVLTGREVQVLELVAAGLANKEVGSELHISERTVARHLSNILTKLGVTSRTAATAAGYERGIIQAPTKK